MSETSGVATSGPAKRVFRTAEEKRRIVEATLVAGASIARVAREHGVNANQVFQWRYEYRNGTGWTVSRQARTELLQVTVAAEPGSLIVPAALGGTASSGSIHFELPGWALVSVEAGVDATLVRAVLESCGARASAWNEDLDYGWVHGSAPRFSRALFGRGDSTGTSAVFWSRLCIPRQERR